MTTTGDRWLLALDTATGIAIVAAGALDGRLLAVDRFAAEHRHSQELLPAVTRVLGGAGLRLADLAGVIVGTGPGAFTGLRVGLATAKTLAHELRVPLVGVPTGQALLRAAATIGVDPTVVELWLPAGPQDIVVVRSGAAPERVSGAALPDPSRESADLQRVVAVDLDGRAPASALRRGAGAVERLPEALLSIGAARLALGEADEPERLVPEYVTAPRGIVGGLDVEGGVAWSRDPR